jgi:signal transduction histidine kinase
MNHALGTAPVRPQKEHNGLKESASPYEAAGVVRHMAHELRQPLSTIESIAYYLDIVLPLHDGKSRVQVERLQQVVQQASWILSDAVHFLQASPPSPQTIDLSEFVSHAVTEAGVTEATWVQLDLSQEPVLARLDPDQSRHLFRNLLFFFRQVSRPNPFVWIKTLNTEDSVQVRFEADGVDFNTAEMEAMFEPFTSHLPAGSGLALASVRRIVEAHNGTLDLQTIAPMKLSLRLSFDLVTA